MYFLETDPDQPTGGVSLGQLAWTTEFSSMAASQQNLVYYLALS